MSDEMIYGTIMRKSVKSQKDKKLIDTQPATRAELGTLVERERNPATVEHPK